jgi:hypothetical protein
VSRPAGNKAGSVKTAQLSERDLLQREAALLGGVRQRGRTANGLVCRRGSGGVVARGLGERMRHRARVVEERTPLRLRRKQAAKREGVVTAGSQGSCPGALPNRGVDNTNGGGLQHLHGAVRVAMIN